MKLVTVREAETHLSRLLGEAEAGEEIIITRDGKPAIRLIPAGGDAPPIIGLLQGKFTVPDDLLDLFDGGPA